MSQIGELLEVVHVTLRDVTAVQDDAGTSPSAGDRRRTPGHAAPLGASDTSLTDAAPASAAS